MWAGCGPSVARVRTGRQAATGKVSLKRHRFSLRRQTSVSRGHRAADARHVGDYRRHQGEPPYLPEPGQDPGRSLEDDGPCSLADDLRNHVLRYVAGDVRDWAQSHKSKESDGGAGKNSPSSSPRNSTRWSQGYLPSTPGRNSDGNVDCDPARTSGRNLTRYSARNRTSSCPRCSRSSGRSSGGSSRRSSPHRSPGDSSGRDFGSYGDSYGGGIGGVGEGVGARALELGKLGPIP